MSEGCEAEVCGIRWHHPGSVICATSARDMCTCTPGGDHPVGDTHLPAESTPDPASVARCSTSPTGESLSKSGSLSSSLIRAPAPSSLATRLPTPLEPPKSSGGAMTPRAKKFGEGLNQRTTRE